MLCKPWWLVTPWWADFLMLLGATLLLLMGISLVRKAHYRYLQFKWAVQDAQLDIKQKDALIASLQKDRDAVLAELKLLRPLKDGGYRKEKDGA